MALHNNQIIGFGEAIGDLLKDLGKIAVRGFGRILGIGIAAAVLGGVGGGIGAAVYGGPIIGFAIAGAVGAAVAVYALCLLFMSEY